MILDIVKYGDPVLRAPGEPIKQIDETVVELAENMLETMYEANGVGLAAQQIGRAVQLTVIDVAGIEDRPSRMWVEGREVEIDSAMPLVLVNPHVQLMGARELGVEGCLSFPEITADILRAERVSVKATGIEGEPIVFEAEGLLARAVQHETDHLNGVLFIDRMSSTTKLGLARRLKQLAKETTGE